MLLGSCLRRYPNFVARVVNDGNLDYDSADIGDGLALRPVLSLGSQTMIISGSGSINDPYLLKTA